jgi:hypothetical protein
LMGAGQISTTYYNSTVCPGISLRVHLEIWVSAFDPKLTLGSFTPRATFGQKRRLLAESQ